VSLVKNFYLSHDSSRISPRSDDVVWVKLPGGGKERKAKQRILFNLNDLYYGFKDKYPNVQISCTTFLNLRPENCVWPGRRGFHVTCICEIHQNFEFMFEALRIDETLETFVRKLVCVDRRMECYFGLCSDCPDAEYLNSCYANISDDEDIEYYQWTHTDSTDLKKVVVSSSIFKENFEKALTKYITHDFVFRKQSEFLRHLKQENLKAENALMIQVDFAQNFSFVIQKAIQVMKMKIPKST